MPECPDLFTLTFREEQSPAPGECQSGHDLTLSYCHCDIPVTSVQSLSSHPMLVYCSTMQNTTALSVPSKYLITGTKRDNYLTRLFGSHFLNGPWCEDGRPSSMLYWKSSSHVLVFLD